MTLKLKLLATLKIWIIIYPALTLFLYLFKEPLSVLPVYLRTFFMTISLVPLIVFAGMPALDLVIRFFTKAVNSRGEAR